MIQSQVALRVNEVGHSFGDLSVIHSLDLAVYRGEFVAVVGPSGCGKSTLLALIAGHLSPTRGQLERWGECRVIYQDGGLLPWLTSRENIELGLRHTQDPGLRSEKLREFISLIKLEGFEGHYPHELSGGMRQRVEWARALASGAEILLMDEPFNALDFPTRIRLRRELLAMLGERPRTVIFVTHDIDEAVQLADRVILLSGRPAQVRYTTRLELPHPRDPGHPELIRTSKELLNSLEREAAAR